eukprot:851982-Rhodomonas_salina.1
MQPRMHTKYCSQSPPQICQQQLPGSTATALARAQRHTGRRPDSVSTIDYHGSARTAMAPRSASTTVNKASARTAAVHQSVSTRVFKACARTAAVPRSVSTTVNKASARTAVAPQSAFTTVYSILSKCKDCCCSLTQICKHVQCKPFASSWTVSPWTMHETEEEPEEPKGAVDSAKSSDDDDIPLINRGKGPAKKQLQFEVGLTQKKAQKHKTAMAALQKLGDTKNQ